jgi:ribonuclease HI
MTASRPQAIMAYTDGGCRGNPGIGAWAFVLVDSSTGTALERSGGVHDTTNNRMELTGAIEALKALRKPVTVLLHSDSEYVTKGMSEWVSGWKRRGWRKSDGKPVINADLWQALDAEAARHTVRWTWVRGHAGHDGNEHVDRLCNEAMDRLSAGGPLLWERRGPWS